MFNLISLGLEAEKVSCETPTEKRVLRDLLSLRGLSDEVVLNQGQMTYLRQYVRDTVSDFKDMSPPNFANSLEALDLDLASRAAFYTLQGAKSFTTLWGAHSPNIRHLEDCFDWENSYEGYYFWKCVRLEMSEALKFDKVPKLSISARYVARNPIHLQVEIDVLKEENEALRNSLSSMSVPKAVRRIQRRAL